MKNISSAKLKEFIEDTQNFINLNEKMTYLQKSIFSDDLKKYELNKRQQNWIKTYDSRLKYLPFNSGSDIFDLVSTIIFCSYDK